MHYQAAAGAIVLAGFALLQSCPAPVFALVAIIPEIVVTGVELGLEFAPNKRSLRVEDAFEVEAKFNPRALDERGTCVSNANVDLTWSITSHVYVFRTPLDTSANCTYYRCLFQRVYHQMSLRTAATL